MHIISRTCAGALAALMALPVLAAPGATALAPPVLAGPPSPSAAPAAASASADVLATARGGSDTRVQGVVDGNSATNVTTGANVIQTGSFANAAGIVAVVQNTGTNVLIQHTAVVNVQFK
jgi:hypothetical protein